MTRYKEYLRAKGYALECDYPILPDYENGIEGVRTSVDLDRRVIRIGICTVMGTFYDIVNTNGEIMGEPLDEDEFTFELWDKEA